MRDAIVATQPCCIARQPEPDVIRRTCITIVKMLFELAEAAEHSGSGTRDTNNIISKDICPGGLGLASSRRMIYR